MNSTRDVLLQTENLDEATSFYTDVFGLTGFLREPNLVGLEAGAFRLFLDRGAPLGPVFEFVAHDFERATAALLQANATVIAEDSAIQRCHMRDPYGLVFDVAQKAASQ